jgi:glycosyltransferase involved in cell wall biosynthesis
MTVTKINRIAFVGDYMPRQCGIATFTTDICEALATAYPDCECIVGAVNDRPEHEFGIYGGPAGSHLLALLRDVRMPVVTTLHTVLREPNEAQRSVMEQLNVLSNRFIVMAERGRELLKEVYGVSTDKIDLIPHGVPDVQFIDPTFHKDQFGVEGKTVLLTFGLLSPNKGIEYVIEALPAILKTHPNVVYIVLGATQARAARGRPRSHRERNLLQPLRDSGGTHGLYWRSRHLRYALSE